MTPIQYPLALVLTHRRGAAIAIQTQAHHTPLMVRTLGQTAENLAALYQGAIALSHLRIQDIKTLAVGIGPGSFTGLRLGCAFGNGLKLGNECSLLGIKTHEPRFFLQRFAGDEESTQEFLTQLGETNEGDTSSGKITFTDVLVALEELPTLGEFMDTLEPHYGREPTPVLLRNAAFANEG
jgi:hypothetical protein